MFINKDSVLVNGISMGEYILEAKFGFHKLWSSDSGRSLSGKQSGTLIGIFPKITLQFRGNLSRERLNIIASLLDSASQTVQYDDPNKNTKVTMITYTGDYEFTYKSLNRNEGFSCAFISTERRK